MGTLPLSVLIPTYNEELHIQRCLESILDLAGEIIVVDSFSTDKTLQIAGKFTRHLVQHGYENHGKQMNWALENLPFAYDWVLQLDADEMLTPELADELRMTLPNVPSHISGLYAKRRVYFMGRWIKHGDYYPIWLLRIFRRGKVRYEEFEDGRAVVLEGEVNYLKHDFIDSNQKGLAFWIDKHNQCSTSEIRWSLAQNSQDREASMKLKPSLFAGQDQRRRWLKKYLYVQTPLFLRAFLHFFYRYFIRLGFLDGVEGLIFHALQGFWYRFVVDAKIYEAEQLKRLHTAK